MEKKHQIALVIFAREPKLGEVKTRLARTVGDQGALNVYNELLRHTREVVDGVQCDKVVFYADKVGYEDVWSHMDFHKFKQEGDDLGIRMYNAFKFLFYRNYRKVIIIGSDCYELRPHHIEQAFEMLDSKDVAIGPAKDGGYYLLGFNRLVKDVFWNKEWSGPDVLSDTILDLQKNDLSFDFLDPLSDVDEEDDLGTLRKFL